MGDLSVSVISTKNFNPVTDPKLKCMCGNEGCDERSVTQSVLNRVQRVRYDAGRPLTITSGGRCSNHEDEVSRATPADHQNCVAVDVAVSGGVERMEIVSLGIKYGATAIGVASTFVHLGWRKDAQPVMWTY